MSAAYTTYKSIAAEAAEVGGQGGDATAERDAMVTAELPQVYYIAARIQERLPQHVQIEDLVHAGVIGLLEAHKNFDASKNAQFKTFARFRIRGAILDSLRELDWGSRSLRRKAREIAEATNNLEGTLGRAPSKEEISHALGMKPAELEEAMTQLDGLYIVGQQGASFDGEEAHDYIELAPSTWENPFELYCRTEEKSRLAAAIADLSEREQLILSLYYREELTMKEVAKVVGIALSRVSQIHFAAIGKLKRVLTPPAMEEAQAAMAAEQAGGNSGAARSTQLRSRQAAPAAEPTSGPATAHPPARPAAAPANPIVPAGTRL